MDAQDAAQLTAILKPDVAVPQHYAFDGGAVGGQLITKSDTDPEHYRTAADQLAPETKVAILAARPAPRPLAQTCQPQQLRRRQLSRPRARPCGCVC